MAPKNNEKELQALISSQEEQLARYKKRLQDVVAAHKKLITEKERLEETLKTITSSVHGSEKLDTSNSEATDSDKEISELKSRISKLAQSLSELTEEKYKLEAQFQIERKQLIQRNNNLEEKLKILSSSIGSDRKIQEVEVENVKSQLHLENHQRELEFASTIRELQKILNEERKKKEDKDYIIEQLRTQLKDNQEKLHESKHIENQLQIQLNETKKRLDHENAPHVVMEKLKREIQLMKEQHNYTVQQEQMRALKAEDRARRQAIEHENRVSKLEQKLAQLSEVANNYNKYRQEDQETITKLKNRLVQLELENTNTKCEDDRLQMTEETLVQQLQHIKQQLIWNCTSASQLNYLKEILMDGLEDIGKDDTKYKQQYFQLKQQFDEFKQRVPKNEHKEELIAARQKIQNLKAKILDIESVKHRLEEELEHHKTNVLKAVDEERQIWKTKLNITESDHHSKVKHLEHELERQKEKSVAAIAEKDKQLSDLQHYFPAYQYPADEPAAAAAAAAAAVAATSGKKASAKAAKRQSSTLIYYMEDAARKEIEINRLRKDNNGLQVRVHELEKEQYQQMQQFVQLQNDIKRLEKQEDGMEELNTRYLRNVFLNYLLTLDGKMRSHMLNAIFAILKFSDLEINKVLKQTPKM